MSLHSCLSIYKLFLVLHGSNPNLWSQYCAVHTCMLLGMLGWCSLMIGKRLLLTHSQKSLANMFGFPLTEEWLWTKSIALSRCSSSNITSYLTYFPLLEGSFTTCNLWWYLKFSKIQGKFQIKFQSRIIVRNLR